MSKNPKLIKLLRNPHSDVSGQMEPIEPGILFIGHLVDQAIEDSVEPDYINEAKKKERIRQEAMSFLFQNDRLERLLTITGMSRSATTIITIRNRALSRQFWHHIQETQTR